jgi:hypothetical protein
VVNRFPEEKALKRNQKTTWSFPDHEIPINREEVEASCESDDLKLPPEAPNRPSVDGTEDSLTPACFDLQPT